MKKFFSSFLIFLLIQTSSTMGIKTDNTQVYENKTQVVSSKSIKNVENKTEEKSLKNVSKEKKAKPNFSEQSVNKSNNFKNDEKNVACKDVNAGKKTWLNTVGIIILNIVYEVFEQAIKIVPYILIKLFL